MEETAFSSSSECRILRALASDGTLFEEVAGRGIGLTGGLCRRLVCREGEIATELLSSRRLKKNRQYSESYKTSGLCLGLLWVVMYYPPYVRENTNE